MRKPETRNQKPEGGNGDHFWFLVSGFWFLVSRTRSSAALRDPLGMPRELEHREARAVHLDPVGPLVRRRQQIAGGVVRDVVVLLDAVAAHAEAADEGAVAHERRRAGEERDAGAAET